ncbi:sigma-54 dependent transcriptional regulator [uncultured Imperialibacter sp.]|uniref:sigma-54-dependent transcriptional regulator n=1 Tax=uncultured Imperialibacter sp. TaxID=1672639 RepID=UPI0030D83093|tara:strand:+ start:19370 stop:20740 length:1371 start_codon:yes stop_codon:yes gene_type:complete
MPKLNANILIIEDDEDVLYTAKLVLKQRFGEVHTETDPKRLPRLLEKTAFDVILLDMNFSHGQTSGNEGLFWLREILKLDSQAHVIMNTAYGDIQLAVEAMKIGAIDFLVKPWEREKLIATVENVFQLSRSKKEVQKLKSREKVITGDIDKAFPDMISRSDEMAPVFEAIEKVAKTDANVLILGENGTGKELVAREIYRQSLRAKEPFIKVDLGSLAESLFESELFGHKKGAFTDAKEDRQGRLEIASGGTLFLDEIGNLTTTQQSKLLTVLQARQVTPIGSNRPVDIDIRLISATNIQLDQVIESGEFRQDLLYRINTVEITLPPLRSRTGDVALLAEHYLNLYASKYNKRQLSLNKAALKKLDQYPWPGNIRELQHTMERAVIMADTTELTADDFPLDKKPQPSQINEVLQKDEMEKQLIQKAIKKWEGNLTKAADEMGMGRTTLYRKMKKYGF